MDGFGEKSYEKLVKAAETAKITTTAKFIYSLGIANIGLSNAKMVCKAFSNDLEKIRHASIDELVEIDVIHISQMLIVGMPYGMKSKLILE